MMIYCKELTHTIMEAEKSHDLPSAGRRPRETDGIDPSETSGLRTWGSVGQPRSEAGREEMRCPNSTRERRVPPPPAFCSIQALNRLDDAHPGRAGRAADSTGSLDSKAKLTWKQPHLHTPK